jgi:hypothetical protein
VDGKGLALVGHHRPVTFIDRVPAKEFEVTWRNHFFAIALLLVGVTATVAQDVRYDYDKDKDFSPFTVNFPY